MLRQKSFARSHVHMHAIDRLALLNGVISGIALYPQVFKVLLSQSVSGVSVITMLLIFINSIVWVVYAVHRGLISVGASAVLNVVAAGILLLAYMVV